MLNNNKNNNNIYIQLMFWFVKTIHYYSAGPESKIGLSYVNVVCVYGGWGEGWGGGVLKVLKCFVKGVRIFLLALCVCVCGGGC